MAVISPISPHLHYKAVDFTLPDTTGKAVQLKDIMRSKGAVVAFICNHCPYVIAIAPRMVRAAEILAGEGIGFVAICANDAEAYPEDSLENMRVFSERNGFIFPYLHDETQRIARAYDAVCTPDFFGLNASMEVKYRGRLDEGRNKPLIPGAKQELVESMRLIARTGEGPVEQNLTVGCSIKWKKV